MQPATTAFDATLLHNKHNPTDEELTKGHVWGMLPVTPSNPLGPVMLVVLDEPEKYTRDRRMADAAVEHGIGLRVDNLPEVAQRYGLRIIGMGDVDESQRQYWRMARDGYISQELQVLRDGERRTV